MNKHYDESEAIAAQTAYCKEHSLPHFAPSNGYCFRCGLQIYGKNGISVEEAGTRLITGCPYCRASYCD